MGEQRATCIARITVSGGNVHNIKDIICEQIMADNTENKILGVEFQKDL